MGGRRDAGRTLSHSVASSSASWSAVGLGAAALVVGGLAVYTVALHDPGPPTTPTATPTSAPTSTPTSTPLAEASPSPSFTPSNRAATVAWVGDSYALGAGGRLGGFVPAVSEARDWDTRNLGVGGSGYVVKAGSPVDEAQKVCGRDYCRAFPEGIQDAAEIRPDIVVVSGGRQDIRASETELEAGVSRFYTELRSALPEARIIAMSPLWDDDPAPPQIATIGRVVEEAATRVDARYVDLGQPLAGRPELVSANGVQPNDAGYDAIAKVVVAKLRAPR